MYRDSKYITPYKAPHTKIYSMNSIDFVYDIQRIYIYIQQYVALILYFNIIYT